MTDENKTQTLTQDEIKILKEDIANRKAFERVWGRIKVYLGFAAAIVGGWVLLGEQIPAMIKAYLGR